MQENTYCQHFNTVKINKKIIVSYISSCSHCLIKTVTPYLCLSKGCEMYFCDSRKGNHMFKHYQETKDKKSPHCIFINVHTSQILCSLCKIQILDLDLLNCRTQGLQDPYPVRLQIVPSLSYLIKNNLTGQLQNSQAHKKINTGLVGIFADKYNQTIIASLQFINKCSYLNHLIKKIRLHQSNITIGEPVYLLFQLKEVLMQMQNALLRAIKINTFAEAVFAHKTTLLSYKRKDPFEILTLILTSLHDYLKYYDTTTYEDTIEYNDDWEASSKCGELKYKSPISDCLSSNLVNNFVCMKCGEKKKNIHKIDIIKLNFPVKRAPPKEMEKQLQNHRCNTPLKSRRKSLMNLIMPSKQQSSLTIHQLLIDFMKQKNQNNQLCSNCKIPMKQQKSYLERLPEVLILVIGRMNKDGDTIANTLVELQKQDIDLGPFSQKSHEKVYFEFQSAICLQKNCLFPVLAKNEYNKQFYKFTNDCYELANTPMNPYIISYRKKVNKETEAMYKNIQSNVDLKISPDYSLPDFWLHKLSFGNESPLYHQLVCFHQRLKPCIQSMMIQQDKVPKQVYEVLIQKYGGKLYKNIECQECKWSIDALNRRKQLERQLINSYQKFKTTINCMIESKWINKWSDFLYKKCQNNYQNKGNLMPGKIDNGLLLKEGKCKEGLKKNQEFKVVNLFIWKILKELYGGGPEIRYKWKKQTINKYDEEILKEIKLQSQQLINIYSINKSQSPSKTKRNQQMVQFNEMP